MNTSRIAASLLVTSGFVAGVTQVLLIRELLLACFGNEVSLGLMLAAWLICGAAGTLLASRWKPPDPSIQRTVGRAVKLAALLGPAVFLAISFARVYLILANIIPMRMAEALAEHRIISHVLTVYIAAQPGEMLGPLHLVLISFGTVLLPAVIEGALFAVGLKVYEQAREADAASAGQAYGLDAIGHLIGGVLLGWAVVTMLNPFTVSCAAVVALWVTAGALARGVELGGKWVAWVGVAFLIALFAGSFPLHRITAAARWHGRELLDEVSSIYGHIAVAKQGEEGVVFFENGVPTGLSPALPSVQHLVQFAMLQHPAPRRVLLIGGGATGGLLEVLKHDPERVEYAEIDPALLRFAEKWVTGPDKQALDDPRVTKLATDGRLLVKQAAAGLRPKYDVIILLLPDPSTALLNRFYTQGWYQEARAALNPRGALVWEMSSSRHYFRDSLLLLNTSILEAASSAFPKRALMTGDGTLAIAVGDERADLTDDYKTIMARMEQRGIEAQIFAVIARERFEPYNKRYVLRELAKSPPVAPNRDLSPIGYYYDQAVWLGFYYPTIEALYVRLGSLQLRDLWLPGAGLLALLLLVGLHRRGRSAYVPLAILITGALGMALELCLLFAFQAFYGYIYRQVGVIIGAFMVGLAVGAMASAAAARKMQASRRPAWALAGTQFVIALFALALPKVLGWMSGGGGVVALSQLVAMIAFPVLTAIIGLAVGAQFPLATRSAQAATDPESTTPPGKAKSQARTAALLYAADLIGASVGAATMGAILIPVLGIPQTCLAAAYLSGGMTLLLVLRATLQR